ALHIDVAAHSEMVTPFLDEFTRFMEQVTLHPPTIPYISNVTGTWITDEEATHPHYWAQHLRQTVRFADGIQEFLQDPQWVLLEVGPGQTLSALTRQHPGRQAEQVVLASLRHPQDRRSDGEALFSTLGQLWLAGVEIDWEAFYKEEQRQRISLTTYPFERQRYWIEPGDQESMFTSARKALRKKRDIADWFYLPSWKRTMPPLLPAVQELSSEAKRWLVFCDNNSLSEQVNGQLRDEGQVVVRVLVGEQFTKLDENSYTIYPGRRDDYDALLSDLQKAGKLPERIIHLWNVSTDEFGPPELDSVEAAEDRGFYSLLHLAKALGKLAAADPLRVEVVTTNVQCVTGQEKLVPVKATVLGPCRVIPQEYPHITCRSVDIQLPSAGTSEEKALAGRLIAELLVESPDSIIAYRGHDRLAQTFVASRLENVCESTLKLRREGV
ncbi:MAG TPA: hypothetical protein VFK47_23105, partial [Ktedonobacteraceae bacterium]|nr:hypothetical protein [Ktedonobacteraceae bacterium]